MSVFSAFSQNFEITSSGSKAERLTLLEFPEWILQAPGFQLFMSDYAGMTFNQGLYRVHNGATAAKWTDIILSAYPQKRGRVGLFAYDWQGNQYALDQDRMRDGEPLILMFAISIGRVLQVEASFVDFHDCEIIDNDDILLRSMFEEWSNHSHKEISPLECVGFIHPLFLGGDESLSNMEVIDMEVNWEISTQILSQI
jgi:hypothetical protein